MADPLHTRPTVRPSAAPCGDGPWSWGLVMLLAAHVAMCAVVAWWVSR